MIEYVEGIDGLDLRPLCSDLKDDCFFWNKDIELFKKALGGSYAICLALQEGRIIGYARILSDGTSFAYLPEIWVNKEYRKQGIAKHMLSILFEKIRGQHLYVFASKSFGFYEKIGFVPQGVGMGRIA